jgi:Zn-dependent protease
MLSQFAAHLVPMGIVAFICGLTVLSLPWRRGRGITRRIAIAAPPTRVWKIFHYDPADPLSAALHEKTVSVERIQGPPEIVEMTLDMSGGHGTSLITVREEIVEERPPEYSASRIIAVNDDPHPFGRDNLCIVELSATRDGTLVTSRWRGETVSLWQYIAIWREFRRHDRKLKQLSETERLPSQPAKTGFSWKAAAVSAAALASFALWFGWIGALVLLAILVIHEFGHWLAFRMSGHPAPRIMLIPFLGGAAIGNHPHKSHFDEAFCALMGPAFSILPVAALLVFTAALAPPQLTTLPGWFLLAQYLDGPAKFITVAAPLLLAFGALNALQMLPILPLDGGQVLRAAIQSVNAIWARRVLLFAAGAGILGFLWMDDYILAAIAALGGAGAWHMESGPSSVRPMSALSLSVIGIGYTVTLAVHVGAVVFGLWALDILFDLL